MTRMLPSAGGGPLAVLQYADDPLIQTLVRDANTLVAAVETFIEKTTKSQLDGTRKVKKIVWPRFASEAAKLSDQFRAYYGLLSAVYAVSTSCVIVNVVSVCIIILSQGYY